MAIKFTPTKLNDVWEITPDVFGDSRGYFSEIWKKPEFEAATGLNPVWIQQNESKSAQGILRGLHYQKGATAQAKLVRAITGTVIDVAVDLRQNSPTFGQSVAVELSGENKKQLFVPRGFAHGFYVKSPEAIFTYMVDNPYSPDTEGGLNWADPDLEIEWGSDLDFSANPPSLNDRDANFPFLKDIPVEDLF